MPLFCTRVGGFCVWRLTFNSEHFFLSIKRASLTPPVAANSNVISVSNLSECLYLKFTSSGHLNLLTEKSSYFLWVCRRLAGPRGDWRSDGVGLSFFLQIWTSIANLRDTECFVSYGSCALLTGWAFLFEYYISRAMIPACLYSLCSLPSTQFLMPFVFRGISWGFYVSPTVQNYLFIVDCNLRLFCLHCYIAHTQQRSQPCMCFLTLNENKYSSKYHLSLVLIKPLYQLLLCFGV